MNISLEDQIKCARRELAQRISYYPNLIKSGRLRADQAEHELEAMSAIIETLERCRRADTNSTRDARMQTKMFFEDEKI